LIYFSIHLFIYFLKKKKKELKEKVTKFKGLLTSANKKLLDHRGKGEEQEIEKVLIHYYSYSTTLLIFFFFFFFFKKMILGRTSKVRRIVNDLFLVLIILNYC